MPSLEFDDYNRDHRLRDARRKKLIAMGLDPRSLKFMKLMCRPYRR